MKRLITMCGTMVLAFVIMTSSVFAGTLISANSGNHKFNSKWSGTPII